MRVLTDVVQSRVFCQLELFSHCVQINEVDAIPLLEEGKIRKELVAPLSLHNLVLIQDPLVVSLG